MNKLLLLPLALLTLNGCAHSQMMERMEAGEVLEKEGRDLERSLEFAQAAEKYEQSEVDYAASRVIAVESKTQVFISHVDLKLSIVSTGQARCLQPDNNPAGSWERAIELYARAERHATDGTFLKMKANSVSAQALCLRPDKNPRGDWEQARAMYERSAKLHDGFEDEKGRGEAIRNQVFCMVQGDFDRLDDVEGARRLLERARKLGDEQAADLLVDSGAAYCSACGSGIGPDDKHCPKCGQDQREPVKKPEQEPKNVRRSPGQGPPGMSNTGSGGPNK